MIEVVAKISRECPIFMAGEDIAISICATNNDTSSPASLAWGCVQLHCDEMLSKESARDGKSAVANTKSTSLPSRSKQTLFSSTPNIIFCDIRLAPRESQQFENTQQLPLHFPPSFKADDGRDGDGFRYVSVAVQHVDAPISVLQLPVRVISLTMDIPLFSHIGSSASPNPFLAKSQKRPSLVDVVTTRLEEMTSVRCNRTFEIKSGESAFANITTLKSLYKLGDDVVVKVAFSHKEVSCLQVLVRVETAEVYLRDEDSRREEHVVVHASENQVTAFVDQMHFKVALPLTATPAFSTDTVQLRWRLHFEFVTTTQRPLPDHLDASAGGVLKLAASLPIETVAWNHYIPVHCCNPFNVALVSSVPSSNASVNV